MNFKLSPLASPPQSFAIQFMNGFVTRSFPILTCLTSSAL